MTEAEQFRLMRLAILWVMCLRKIDLPFTRQRAVNELRLQLYEKLLDAGYYPKVNSKGQLELKVWR